MNAYERRRQKRRAKAAVINQRKREAYALQKHQAERAYVHAFTELNGHAPRRIPRLSWRRLSDATRLLWAQLHEHNMRSDS